MVEDSRGKVKLHFGKTDKNWKQAIYTHRLKPYQETVTSEHWTIITILLAV